MNAGIRRLTSCLLALSAIVLCAWQDAQQADQSQPVPGPGAIVASRQADAVIVITVKGGIDSVTSFSVQRRIRQAEEAGADAIVLDINSPGGELGAVLEISGALKNTSVPITVAWIHPQAYSGGAIIALACQEIVVSPGAQMGDAFPITFVNKGGRMGIRALTPDERTKLLPPLLADVVDSARRSGYDEYLVQAMVMDGIELWLVENKETGRRFAINENEYRNVFSQSPPRTKPLIATATGTRQSASTRPPSNPDPVSAQSLADEELHYQPASPSLADLKTAVTDRLSVSTKRPNFDTSQQGKWNSLGYITDGSAAIVLDSMLMQSFGFSSSTIKNDEELKAFLGAKTLVRLDQSWSETASRFLTTMGVRFVLIAVFLLALFIEMSSPGVMLPGAIAIGAGVLLLAPPMIIGMANWWEIGAILLGVVFILLEIFVLPGFGIFGVLGLVALFGGLIGTFIPNGPGILPSDPDATSAAIKGMVTILLALSTAGIGMFFISRHFGSIPVLGRLILQDPSSDSGELSLTSIMGTDLDERISVGDRGITTTPLKPVGQADINDQIIDVVSDLGFIDPGTPVRVVDARKNRVIVEQIEPEEGSA